MLVENGQRKDLNPMEQAFGLALIKEQKNCSELEIGEMIGRSQPWVSDRLRLLGLNPDEQQAIRDGRMTVTEGKRIGRLNTGKTRPGAAGKKGGGYFTSGHELGEAASKRCKALGHKGGGPNYVAIACGKCWEHVIRANERTLNQQQAIANGHCGTCGQPVDVAKDEQTSDEASNSEK
jgi:ParB family chromosome partitioning protein